MRNYYSEYDNMRNKKPWYVVSNHTLAQVFCTISLGLLGINYLFYSFFQFDFNRNLLRVIAGVFLLLSIFLSKSISQREMFLVPVAIYMIAINGSLSSNIAYIILSALAIPYVADIVWKRLNAIQVFYTVMIFFCLLTGVVHYRITTSGGRIRNTLGFVNVNSAALFFFSLLIIWILQLSEIRVKHLIITIIVSFVVYRYTDSRTVFICSNIFAVCYLLFRKCNGKKTATLFCVIVSLFYLSPMLIILLQRYYPNLDVILSFRLTNYMEYIGGHDAKTLLLGGSRLEGIDQFYLCLLYNGGLVFYSFTMIMSLVSLYKYVTSKDSGYAAFIIAVSSYGLMESGVIRCELLCMIMFWYLLIRPLKNNEKE